MKAKKISLHSIEETILKVTSHPLFLTGVGLALNATAYRKLAQRKILNSALNLLELPNRTQQDKALYLLSQMDSRIEKLEKALKKEPLPVTASAETMPTRRPYLEESSFR